MAVEYVPVLRSISPKYSIKIQLNTVIAALKVNIVIITWLYDECWCTYVTTIYCIDTDTF